MKKFSVDVDFTMSKTIEVLAENEEHAMEIADGMINDNPYGYANGFSHFVTYEIIDVNEED